MAFSEEIVEVTKELNFFTQKKIEINNLENII